MMTRRHDVTIGKIRPRQKPTPGTMGKLEMKYIKEVLDPKLRAGEILVYRYEAIKLKLAPNTFYTPDFVVTFEDRIELHEVKGFWEDDARVKIKVAATLFHEFVFIAAENRKRPEDKAIRGAPRFWYFEEIKPA